MEERQAIIDELEQNFMAVDDGEISSLIGQIEKANKIFFFGYGREMMILSAFAMRIFHMGYDAYVVGEPHVPPIAKGDLLTMGLGPGLSVGTETSIIHLETARRIGATTAVFSAHPERVPKTADYLIRIPGQTLAEEPGSLRSVQPMGASYEQALFVSLDYIIKCIMARNNWAETDLSRRHTNME
jgi:6-phospho-3-hexuloisomerase